MNDSELSRLNVEQLQMISERSTGRRVSAWLLAFDSTTHFAFCGFLPQTKWLRLWLAIRFLPAFFDRPKKAGMVVLMKQKLPIICFM
ncbi:hypothetical protein J6O86_05195 [bacterium]|nr:hypothetical protein [bacterium]